MDYTKMDSDELVKLLVTQAQRITAGYMDHKVFAAARNEVLRRLEEWELEKPVLKVETEQPSAEPKRSYRSKRKKVSE